jgi:putative ABC transport system substrate-binding protein
MRGRRIGWILTTFALATAQGAFAQSADRMYRVGSILSLPPKSPDQIALRDLFEQVMREGGFEVGRNLTMERRYGRGEREQEERFAAELVEMKVDVIVAAGSSASLAAKRATNTIPIVMIAAANPERTGLVASLARPGGNVTGTSNVNMETNTKVYELVKEVLPQISRIGIFWNSDNPASAVAIKNEIPVVKSLGMTPVPLNVRTAADLEGAFETALRERVELLELHLSVASNARSILAFAAKHRLPVAGWPRITQGGALIGFGADTSEIVRQVAAMVVRILKGANPADMPVEQSTKVKLVINLKTANALGLTIPQSILLRADRVIE